VDCVLLTSANAARHSGPRLRAFTHLPCFAVGETSAAAAMEAGFTDIWVGDGDGAGLFARAAAAGMKRPLHPCGRDHIPLADPRMRVERRITFASEAEPALPDLALSALRKGALALLHSPRAGALFGEFVDAEGLDRRTIAIAALSENVAAAAGPGWKAAAIAERPSDHALLELAAKLCQTGGSATGICG
jgi:uroporphyrinogen-III synthase